jgi:drug/metabolite transporter (DMT)-like permease
VIEAQTDWFAITLLCAFSLAASDAASKAWLGEYSTWELALVRFSLAGLLLAPGLWWFPFAWPEPVFWLWMAALAPLEILAMLLYMRAIRDHPLSLTLPYLAFTPVFVLFTGWLLLGEIPDGGGFIGVLLVVAGGYLLNARHARGADWRTWLAPLRAIGYAAGSRLMLAAAAIYSLTSVMGKAAMQYVPAASFGPLYFTVLGVLCALLFSLRDPGIFKRVLRRPKAAFAVAALTAVMIVSHFVALSRVEVAYMISVKRSSLLFGILFGAILFQERHVAGNLLAGGIMLVGVGLILL